MTNLDSVLKNRHHFASKDPNSQSYGFSSSHVWMWNLDHKEDWALKNWCFGIVVLEKTLESPLDSKEIKPVNTKGNQPSLFFGRTNAEAEAPRLWPPDAKSQLIGKNPDTGKDWGQEEKGTTEEEMVGWHHWLNGHENESESESHSAVSTSLRPHVLYSLWNSPGQNTGVGSLSLLQGTFPTQVSHTAGYWLIIAIV